MIKGIHHVSMKCGDPEKFNEAKRFYTELLGLKIAREWENGVMIDTGAGMIEIFSDGEGNGTCGAVRHFALASDDVDGAVETVAKAGYDVFTPPKDAVINSVPPYPIRIAFCVGPLGEEIEFFCER